MKSNMTVLEWLQESFPNKDILFEATEHILIETIVDSELEFRWNDDEFTLEYNKRKEKLNDLLNSPAESVYMGEIGSLLLEVRK